MRVELLSSIDKIDRERWNSIVQRNHLICRHEYLSAIEKSEINDCRYYYPVVYDDDQIVAHACLYYISTELDIFAEGIVKKGINYVRSFWPHFLVLRSVECGTPVALGSTISFRDGVRRTEVFDLIVRESERLARELKVHVVMFRDFYGDELAFFDGIMKSNYVRIHNLPSTRMAVKWDNFDGYLNSLRSRYRNKTLSRIERLKESGVTLKVVDDFASHTEVLAELWRNVYDRAKEYRREILLEDFFANINGELSDKTAVIMAENSDHFVGFMLLLFDDCTLVPLFCGLDYSYSKDNALYFNLFYKCIEVATERGCRDIDFGITTIIPKIEIGAEVEMLHMFMKHLNPIMNCFVPKLFDMMTPGAPVKKRKVLK